MGGRVEIGKVKNKLLRDSMTFSGKNILLKLLCIFLHTKQHLRVQK